MAWVYLIIAGIFEWGWPVGLKLGLAGTGARWIWIALIYPRKFSFDHNPRLWSDNAVIRLLNRYSMSSNNTLEPRMKVKQKRLL